MINLDNILKSRHYFADSGSCRQSYGFFINQVWMWEVDHKKSWKSKNWCFWTAVLKTLESPLDCKEIKPRSQSWKKSTLNIHRKDWCWSPNTLAMWCKEPTHWKRPWCWKKIEGRRRRQWQRTRWLDGIIDSMHINVSKLWEIVKDREAWYAAIQGLAKS